MNYKCIWDGEMSNIEATDREVDGWEVFATFKEAKKALLNDLRGRKGALMYTIKRVRGMKEKDART